MYRSLDPKILGGENFSKRRNEMKEQNLQYIINLATQVVGINNVSYRQALSSYELKSFSFFLSDRVMKDVKKMTPETLGRICAFGLYPGGTTSWVDCSNFIRKTGIKDVHSGDFSAENSGRDLLEDIAIAVIVAAAFDILHQEEYQKNAE
ncbi:MAG: hypothetical protein ABIG73_00450 [Patescibacteria group bacterium]